MRHPSRAGAQGIDSPIDATVRLHLLEPCLLTLRQCGQALLHHHVSGNLLHLLEGEAGENGLVNLCEAGRREFRWLPAVHMAEPVLDLLAAAGVELNEVHLREGTAPNISVSLVVRLGRELFALHVEGRERRASFQLQLVQLRV